MDVCVCVCGCWKFLFRLSAIQKCSAQCFLIGFIMTVIAECLTLLADACRLACGKLDRRLYFVALGS